MVMTEYGEVPAGFKPGIDDDLELEARLEGEVAITTNRILNDEPIEGDEV